MSETKIENKEVINQIEKVVKEAQSYVVSTVNTVLLQTYLKIGELLSHQINVSLRDLEKQLRPKYGVGFSRRNLSKMIIFFKDYGSGETLAPHLSWSHYFELLSIKNHNERKFYENECNKCCWNVRELIRQIDSSLYERTLLGQADSTGKLPSKVSEDKSENVFLKNPLVFEFVNLDNNFKEKDLESELVKHLKLFLLELGKGFAFVGEQQRIVVNGKSYYVDLVFYNANLKCYVLIELKKGKVTNNSIEQLNFYLNYYKNEINKENDVDPIGIVLCQDKDDIQVEYALGSISNQIFVRKYLTQLPDKELLRAEIQKFLK